MPPGDKEPAIVREARDYVAEHFRKHGNVIEPVFFYRKDGEIQTPVLIRIPEEVMSIVDLHERVIEAFVGSVAALGPSEAVLVHQGFFMADDSGRSCLRIVYSTHGEDRTFVTPILGPCEVGEWQEIVVLAGDLYQVFRRVSAIWN